MRNLKLTDPQEGALQCRDWSEEPELLAAWTPGSLAVAAGAEDVLFHQVCDASNAEDEHAEELRRSGDLECAKLAQRSARVLANLAGRILI